MSYAKARAELVWYVREPAPIYVGNLRWLAALPFLDQVWLGFGHTAPAKGLCCPRRGVGLFPLIFGSTFVLTGLVPIWLALRTFAKDRAIARWPRAPGRVTVSRVDSRISTRRDKQGYDHRYTVYDAVVQFTYAVDGRELQGDRLARVAISSGTPPDLSRYPSGQDVMVFYDPNDPRTAYLEVHRSTGAIILCVFGGVFLVVGILVPTLVMLA